MSTPKTTRWVGWVRCEAQPPWVETLEPILDAPEKYGARLHVSAFAGGYGGGAGKALCGVNVPADDGDNPLLWVDETDLGVPHCKRCDKKAKETR